MGEEGFANSVVPSSLSSLDSVSVPLHHPTLA